MLMMPCHGISAGEPAEAVVHSTITPERAEPVLRWLSDDERMGRNTPSPGLDSSAAYIQRKLQAAGAQPIGNSWFHTYELEQRDLKVSSLVLHQGDTSAPMVVKDDYVPFSECGDIATGASPVIFAGFGNMTLPENTRGAVIVLFRGRPPMSVPLAPEVPTGRRQYQEYLVEKARSAGALGVLLVDRPGTRESLRPTGSLWPSLMTGRIEPPLSLIAAPKRALFVSHIGTRVVEKLFGSLDSLRSLETQAQETSFIPFTVSGIKAEAKAAFNRTTVSVKNVHAVIPGSTKPDEYVVIGAHYDHVGHKEASTDEETSMPADSIFNGADDNASGTTGLILAAEAIGAMPEKPARSVVFIAFSGEEKGLLGSKAWVRDAPLPIDRIAAMLNMDMISRNSPDTISLGGKTRCQPLAELTEKINSRQQATLAINYDIESLFFRSDQANFALEGIPVLFYFSGMHADYHKVTDEFALCNLDKLTRITRLCTLTAVEVANMATRFPCDPRVDPAKEE